VVFGGHVVGETCFRNSTYTLGCFESLYLYRASTGKIQSIAHQGDQAPPFKNGDTFTAAFMGMPNNSGEIAFIGSTSTDATLPTSGVYLWRPQSGLEKVAIPGEVLFDDRMMMRATPSQCCVDINRTGEVAFAAQLDADDNGDGVPDTGVFVKLGGTFRKVVSSGDVLPHIGTVQHVNWTIAAPIAPAPFPAPFVNLNDQGQVLTQVILEDGKNHVIVATPH
jgi:hypothetical protein